MNTSNLDNSPFGALNWSVNKEVSYILTDSITNINYFGVVLEFTVIVFFIVNFWDTKSQFRTSYFCIYTIGCTVDFLSKFFLIAHSLTKIFILSFIINFSKWYNRNFITLWILLLALNRFTAIMFSMGFSQIWTKRTSIVVCVLLMIYPFIIHCFNPVFFWCYIISSGSSISSFCTNSIETEFEQIFSLTSDIGYTILATMFGVIAAINMLIKRKTRNQIPEKVLLVQSLTSSVFLVLSSVTAWLVTQNKTPVGTKKGPEYTRLLSLQLFLASLSAFFFNVHHYAGLILLFLMSHSFRTKYLEFYKVLRLFKCFKKQPKIQPLKTISIVPEVSQPIKPQSFKNTVGHS